MRKVLLVDDSNPIRKVASLTFSDIEVNFEAVADADEAMQLVEQGWTPELAIVDVHLPRVGGLELCRDLKGRFPELPVLLLVGTFEPFDEADGHAAGASGVLLKPFSADELRTTALSLLGDSELEESSSEPSGDEEEGLGGVEERARSEGVANRDEEESAYRDEVDLESSDVPVEAAAADDEPEGLASTQEQEGFDEEEEGDDEESQTNSEIESASSVETGMVQSEDETTSAEVPRILMNGLSSESEADEQHAAVATDPAAELRLSEEQLDRLASKIATQLTSGDWPQRIDEIFLHVAEQQVRERIERLEKEVEAESDDQSEEQ